MIYLKYIFSWINPWFIFFEINRFRFLIFNFSNLVFLSILFLFVLLGVIYNHNLLIFVNYIAIFLLFLIKIPNCPDRSNKLYYFGIFYVLLGMFCGLLFSFLSDGRTGIFGLEPNFSAFVIGLLMLGCLVRHDYKLLFFIYIFGVFLTGSRMLFLVGFISIIYFYMREKTFYSYLLFSLFSLSVIFGEFLILYFSDLNLISSGGYIDGPARLIQFSDSSSNQRLLLFQSYLTYIIDNPLDAVFGLPKSTLDMLVLGDIGRMPHNSYLEKCLTQGLAILLTTIYLIFKKLPLWVTLTWLSYAFFLHNLLSLPLIIFLMILVNEK